MAKKTQNWGITQNGYANGLKKMKSVNRYNNMKKIYLKGVNSCFEIFDLRKWHTEFFRKHPDLAKFWRIKCGRMGQSNH